MKPIIDFLNRVHLGNNINILKEMPDESVDCIVTDPPYALVSGEYRNDKEFNGGFMNQSWDSKLPSVDFWKECLRIMKSGAFAFIMCSPRQDVFARMIVNLQDAGFKTDMTSLYHTYSSGFPKAGNISKMIDRKLGFEREIIGQKKLNPRDKKIYTPNTYDGLQGTDTFVKNPSMNMITLPSSEEAKNFDGSYAGFQPKPAVEIVIVVMKPLSEKSFVDQTLKNGKGITWLQDCRIPFQSKSDYEEVVNNFKGGLERASPEEKESWQLHEGGWKLGNGIEIPDESKGRFPANLLVSDNVLNEHNVFPSCLSGNNDNGLSKKYYGYDNKFENATFNFGNKTTERIRVISDSGSYSRYFSLDAWWDKQIKNLPDEVQKVFPFLIVPKASKNERQEGCGELTDEVYNDDSRIDKDAIGCNNPRNRSGKPKIGNIHPTVKPLKLFSYLIILGSRPNDVILDPFCGSGTAGVACHLLNRNFICIDIEPQYVKIAKTRIGHIQSNTPHVKPIAVLGSI